MFAAIWLFYLLSPLTAAWDRQTSAAGSGSSPRWRSPLST
jgi:hypothetical protein